jgi:ribosomal protein L40E
VPTPAAKDAPTLAADTKDAAAPDNVVAAPNACSGCGTTNDDDAQFCKKCGLKLA